MEAMRSNSRPWEQQSLINDLKQGRELAEQLKNHLNTSTASSQTRHYLVEKIISSYEKTLTKLNRSMDSVAPLSPCYKSNEYSNSPNASKKRKALPKWTEQVQVKLETGLEDPLDDGHGWRKYGQKDILGANHPRGYYRCRHRHAQGCLATKQVQKSDEDPTVFHITYRGQHSCTKAAHCTSLNTQQQEMGAKVIKDVASPKPAQQPKRIKLDVSHDQFQFSFEARDADNLLVEQAFPTFSSLASKPDDYVFMQYAEAEEDQFMSGTEGSFSPFYISPATSDTEIFQPCQLGLSQLNVEISESDLVEASGSCLNSVSNSPMGVLDLDWDFPIGSAGMDFDSSFLLGFLDFQ